MKKTQGFGTSLLKTVPIVKPAPPVNPAATVPSPELEQLRANPEESAIRHRIIPGSEALAIRAWRELKADQAACLLVEASGVCHVGCAYCAWREQRQVFSLPAFQRLLAGMGRRGLLSVWLTGGEVLHAPDRFEQICRSCENTGIDVEKVSTSLVGSRQQIERISAALSRAQQVNRLFRTTISITPTSAFNAWRSGPIAEFTESMISRIEMLLTGLKPERLALHFPVIQEEANALGLRPALDEMARRFPQATWSFKHLVPRADGAWAGAMIHLDQMDFASLMNCGTASLIPCTWPMWHLRADGTLYCCSTWFHPEKSLNSLGRIDELIELNGIQQSAFMKALVAGGGVAPLVARACCVKPGTGMQMVPDFMDHTQKCFACRHAMEAFDA